jgi:DNA-binding HxlR family transcriptional regulator
MVLLDVLGQRWTLRILWELRDGALSFRALQARCDQISPTVLNSRLAQLRQMRLVESTPEGYQTTDLGRQLGRQLNSLDAWADVWARKME